MLTLERTARWIACLPLPLLLSVASGACDSGADSDQPPAAQLKQRATFGHQDLPPRARGGATVPAHPKLSTALARLVSAHAAADRAEIARLERSYGLELDPLANDVLVQVRLEPGHQAEAPSDASLRAQGARVRSRGTSLLDLWVPIEGLLDLAEFHPDIQRISRPRRPYSSYGAVESQGVAAVGAERMHCVNASGTGVHVAVVDVNFSNFAQAQAAGEIDPSITAPPPGRSSHGTACSEIVFDVAPGVALEPVPVATLADLQSFVAGLDGAETQIVSDSLVWMGDSFSDGTGPHCELLATAQQAGVVWVTSAGNHGYGSFYAGTFLDADQDGQHEFAEEDELNEIALSADLSIAIEMDWDAYPQTDQDYDLFLYRQEGQDWTVVASSTDLQDGSAAPRETILYTTPAAGTYAIGVASNGADQPDMRFRVFVFPSMGLELQYWQGAQSLADPAHCDEALTVGAVVHQNYASAQVWHYSSRGPTSDDRVKPDIVAPTAVRTSTIGTFYGTSSSAPHVAGALALYIGLSGETPAQAAQLLLADAVDMANPVPDPVSGHGRMILDGGRAGWQCAPQSSGDCTTSCGSVGVGSCGDDCLWAVCQPPAETCNGIDDDCDGQVPADEADGDGDDHLICGGDCDDTLASVFPSAPELCNGIDDDCDGDVPDDEIDADGDGARLCDGDCADDDPQVYPGAAEQCNQIDDDCDGQVPINETDGDGDGVRACEGDCNDTDPSVHPGATEQCNGIDDDCDQALPTDEADADADGLRICDGDCDDTSASAHPGAVELCNGQDDDCDGLIPEIEQDTDGDGVSVCQLDCDDDNADTYPGAIELCNDVDDNCDGAIDNNCRTEAANEVDDDAGCRCGAAGAGSAPLLVGLVGAALLARRRR